MKDMKRFNTVNDCLSIIGKQLDMIKHTMCNGDANIFVQSRIDKIVGVVGELDKISYDMYCKEPVHGKDSIDADILADMAAMADDMEIETPVNDEPEPVNDEPEPVNDEPEPVNDEPVI